MLYWMSLQGKLREPSNNKESQKVVFIFFDHPCESFWVQTFHIDHLYYSRPYPCQRANILVVVVDIFCFHCLTIQWEMK